MAALLLMLAAGCSDDHTLLPDTDGFIENEEGMRVTVLHLSGRDIDAAAWQSPRDVSFILEDPARRISFTLEGTAQHDGEAVAMHEPGTMKCRMRIGETDIPDGDYYLKLLHDGNAVGRMRRVAFSGNVGTEIASEQMDYTDLEGDGTQQNPYLINDDGDFLTLIYYLQEDPDHAYGRYFRQTASFDVPRRSMIIDGHIYAPVTFAGIYDGGGHELRGLTYQGASSAESDNDIGLFRDLYSATVRNIDFSGALIINGGSRVGIIAGKAEGNCTFENITASGTVTADGDDIGGLAGLTSGNVTFRDITFNSVVVASGSTTSHGKGAGLLVGRHEGDSFTAENITVADHIFSVTGYRSVGGVAGHVKCKSVHVKNVSLEHSVDQETQDIKVIYGAENYVGGLFGWLEHTGDAGFSGCSVKAPVSGGRDAGALAGHAYVHNLTLTRIMLTSVVHGGTTVGGMFGYAGFCQPSSRITFAGPDNSSRIVVKSSTSAEVSGDDYVGGLAGMFDSHNGSMVFEGKVEIGVNVSGKNNVGGAFGSIMNADGFSPYDISFSSPTMRVEASNGNAGGFAGEARDSRIDGGLDLSPLTSPPSASSMKPCFGGVVTAGGNAGGVVGYSTGNRTSIVSGVYSDATVTSHNLDAGGIVGRFDGAPTHKAAECMFGGVVDAKVSSGGIAGVCTGNLEITECINAGTIRGESNVGGVSGYVKAADNAYLYVTHCLNTGHVTGKCSGGVLGYVTSNNTDRKQGKFDVTYCVNKGRIESHGDEGCPVGGVVAQMNHRHAYIMSCTNIGEVSCPRNYVVAGVVGDMGDRGSSHHNHGQITQCANYGKIWSGDSQTIVGGVVGRLHGCSVEKYDHKITDCANYGELPTDQKEDNGGILGWADSYTNIYRTFNRGKVWHGNAIIGTHLGGSIFHHDHNYYLDGTRGGWPSSTKVSAGNIADKNVYKDFDFFNVWQMTADGPRLRYAPCQP